LYFNIGYNPRFISHDIYHNHSNKSLWVVLWIKKVLAPKFIGTSSHPSVSLLTVVSLRNYEINGIFISLT